MATKRKLPARNKKGQFITKGQAKKKRTQIRKGGKPSIATCSTAGSNLKRKSTPKKKRSGAGKTLRRC